MLLCYRSLRAGILLSLLLASLPESGAATSEALLLTLAGTAEINGREAGAGAAIRPGDLVTTRPWSRATLKLNELTQLRLGENSRVRLLPAEGAPALRFAFEQGSFYFFSRDRPGTWSFETPSLVGTNRGTEFGLQAEAQSGITIVSVLEGVVDIAATGVTQVLRKNERGVARPGEPPSGPFRIETHNVVQWWLFYPAVIDADEIPFSEEERRILGDSIAAYESGNFALALKLWPQERSPASDAERIYVAALALVVGKTEIAEIQSARAESLPQAAAAIRRLIAAVNLSTNSFPAPQSASEWLAQSYWEQAQSSSADALKNARLAAAQAVALAPRFGPAWQRLAELEFSEGNLLRAKAHLTQALELAPGHAQAHALQGFIWGAENRYTNAQQAFDRAIALDGSMGNAWLGKGLLLLRQGRSNEGIAALTTAASQERNRSLLHSYLGKALANRGAAEKARDEFREARALDPNDPTPWFYSALLDQQEREINSAVLDLEKSIDLNDHRALYRSRLLLDQDRAVRGANLAQVYQDAGMPQVAIREATRAVESDYGNASAHLFLANSFDALRDPSRIELRYETPWFHELLMANLLAPVGGGRLSQFVSQQEYSKFFEADGLGANLFTEVRTDSEFLSSASASGTYGKTAFGIDLLHRQSDGDRSNADNERTEIYGQFKQEITPTDTFYFLGKFHVEEGGDLFKTYDNQPLYPNQRFKERQEPGLLLAGWNHQWRPGRRTLFLGGRLADEQILVNPEVNQALVLRDSSALGPGFVREVNGQARFTDPALEGSVTVAPDGESLIFSPALLNAFAPYRDSGEITAVGQFPFNYFAERSFEIYSAELQHIEQTEDNTVLVGARFQAGEFDSQAKLSVLRPNPLGFSSPASDQSFSTDYQRAGVYLYDFWTATPWLTLLAGGSWDRLDHPENSRLPPFSEGRREDEHFSGKVGFTLASSRLFRLRGVYTEALGGVSFDESVTLEPIQLAGFSQAYRTVLSESIAGSVEAPRFKIWGFGIDGTLPSQTWWGASFSLIRQQAERTVGVFTGYQPGVFPIEPAFFPGSIEERLSYRERSVEVTINQLLGEEFTVGALYRVTDSSLRDQYPEISEAVDPTGDLKGSALLHELSFSGNWNSHHGWFARGEANYYAQTLQDEAHFFSPGAPPDAEESFWQMNFFLGYRFRANRAEISAGLLNIADVDYRLSPLNPYGRIPRERTGVLRCRFSL